MTKTKALIGALAILFLVAVVTVVVAVRAANHADHLATVIQQQRIASSRSSCDDQNTRHDNTVKALNHLLAVAVGQSTPSARARRRASEAPTILLIDALAPKRDCDVVVARATGGAMPKPKPKPAK